jgi:hypothetical protein
MKKIESNEQYHSNQAIGSTLLKKIASKSVLHALTEERSETPALILGSAIHCAVLEPEKFNSQYAVSPKFDRRTKEGKVLAEAFELAAMGKTCLTEDQLEITKGVVESIKGHKIANGMLTGGEAEYSYYATDSVTGLELKCKPDFYNMNALIDLKTCQDASVDGFARACANFGYHLQAAYYLDVFNLANGTELKEFYFVAVETSKPFAVNTFLMGEAEIELGRYQYKKALKQYAEYLKSPESLINYGYELKINEIVFPMWAFEKMGA